MKMELRMNPTSIETNESGELVVSGYVNKTEQRSEMLGNKQKFTEVIKKGAWQRAIDNAKEVHFLAEHDKSKILASTRNGSLELREDEVGLHMKATISPTSWGKDYYQLIKDGILQNMSFGFRAVKDAWRNLGSHFERTVNDLELFEVSVVRDPAYVSSSISARGIDLVEDEVPAEELNVRNIEIRNDADIEAIAKKLFEMLKESTKVAEGHEVKTETVIDEVEKVDEVEKTEIEKTDVQNEVKTDEETEEIKEEESESEETEKQEEQVEEKQEDKQEEKNDADKIREFINKFKNTEE